jgi:8-amino-7-oxononanoate synthase
MVVGSRVDGALSNSVMDSVFAAVRRALPENAECHLTLDTPLDETGLDSLARMHVLNCLEEEFGVRFSEDSLYDMETCRDVVEYIESNGSRVPASRQSAVPPPVACDASATAVPKSPSCDEDSSASGPISATTYDVSLFPECVAFQERLLMTAAAGLENPFFRVKDRVCKGAATIAGRDVVSYTSFDYLGMANDPRVMAAAKEAIDQFGTSASASRLVGGNHAILPQLDEAIARFVGTESAVVFPSGFGTNASVLGHLFGEKDLILYDELAHNSIVQGSTLSRAQRRPFPHNDFAFLDNLLRDIRGNYRRVVVAIEGVYSMDGDYPDLPHVLEVKKRHGALLYVDEAHSIGVMGSTGRGICEHFGVDPNEGDLWMGTISKALGSLGGYLAGRHVLIQYLKYTTPSFVFATGLSPANTAAALAAVQLLQEEPERVTRLRDRSRLFLNLAKDSGLNTGNSQDTPVIPVILGDSMRCVRVGAELLRRGVDAQPILYPAVPDSQSRLRFFITAEHSEEDICRTVQLLLECLAATE